MGKSHINCAKIEYIIIICNAYIHHLRHENMIKAPNKMETSRGSFEIGLAYTYIIIFAPS